MDGIAGRLDSTIRASLASAALVVAFLGQRWLNDDRYMAALCAYGLAIIVFVFAAGNFSERVFTSHELTIAPMVAKQLVNVWWVIAVVSALAVAVLFDVRDPSGRHWLLWLLSVALGLFAAWQSDRIPSSADEGPSGQTVSVEDTASSRETARSTEWWWIAALAAVIALAFGLRFWDLGGTPYGFWYDEAETGRQAQLIRNDGGYRPLFIGGTFRAPGTFAYATAIVTAFFGESMAGVRLVSALMGTATVAAIFFAARRWWGPAFGLVAAALLAFSRWHLTVSRVAMNNIALPLFAALTLAFLLRAVRRGRQIDYAIAGLCAALGMGFYSALLASLIAIGVMILALVIGRRSFGSFTPGLVVALVMAVITILPVLKFAFVESEEFFARSRETSLFGDASVLDGNNSFVRNFRLYVQMFNVKGDPNGRHNASGEPMLSAFLGPMAVLGFAVAVRRLRHPIAFGLVLWVLTGLIPGALTLPFESPNTLRAIGSLLPSYLLATVPIIILGTMWWRERDKIALPAMVVLAVVVLFAGVNDANGYFHRQKNNARTWAEHSVRETITADLVNQAGTDGPSIWLVNQLQGSPTLSYLTEGRDDYRWFATDTLLPMPIPADRDALIVTSPESDAFINQVRETFPNAEVTPHVLNEREYPALFSIVVPAADLAATQGLDRLAGGVSERVSTLEGPVTDRAEWSGALVIGKGGVYGMRVSGAPESVLLIDGRSEATCSAAGGEHLVELSAGLHALNVIVDGTAENVVFEWRPPGGDWQPVPREHLAPPPISEQGLTARIFEGGELDGKSKLDRIDPTVDFVWHTLRSNRPYALEWRGSLQVDTPGTYQFWLQADDPATLSLDGEQIASIELEGGEMVATIDLQAGEHPIVATYRDIQLFSRMRIWWQPPDQPRVPVPPNVLRPDIDVDSGGDTGSVQAGTERSEIAPTLLDFPNARSITATSDRIVALAPNLLRVFSPSGEQLEDIEIESGDPTDLDFVTATKVVVLDATGTLEQVDVVTGDRELIRPDPLFTNARGIGAAATPREVLVAHTAAQWINGFNLETRTTETLWQGPGAQPTDVVALVEGFAVLDPASGTMTLTGREADDECIAILREGTVAGPHLEVDVTGVPWASSPAAGSVTRFADELISVWAMPGSSPSGLALSGTTVWFTDSLAGTVGWFDAATG